MPDAGGEHTNRLGQPVGAELAGWSPRLRPPHTALDGRLCRLEPLDLDRHAEALHRAYAADAEGRNWTYLPYGPFDSAQAWAATLSAVARLTDALFYAIAPAGSAQPVGVASYLRIEPAMGSIEVGHLAYSPQLQRHPAATEAMYLMMRHVFDELGYRRYEWKCDDRNQASRRAALRLGFRFEGIFRQHMVIKGRNRDTAWYAILDSEWPALRAAFEQWLDPANFDAAGRQRTRLEALRA
jgi:RimJ/RimL family protein N-acetyltransferase